MWNSIVSVPDHCLFIYFSLTNGIDKWSDFYLSYALFAFIEEAEYLLPSFYLVQYIRHVCFENATQIITKSYIYNI